MSRSAALDHRIDQPLNGLALTLVDEASDVGSVCRTTDLERFGPLHKRVGEGLCDPVLDIEAVGRDAGLTVVTHLRQHRAVHRDIAAFDEIVGASKNHRVPTFSIARALVAPRRKLGCA